MAECNLDGGTIDFNDWFSNQRLWGDLFLSQSTPFANPTWDNFCRLYRLQLRILLACLSMHTFKPRWYCYHLNIFSTNNENIFCDQKERPAIFQCRLLVKPFVMWISNIMSVPTPSFSILYLNFDSDSSPFSPLLSFPSSSMRACLNSMAACLRKPFPK